MQPGNGGTSVNREHLTICRAWRLVHSAKQGKQRRHQVNERHRIVAPLRHAPGNADQEWNTHLLVGKPRPVGKPDIILAERLPMIRGEHDHPGAVLLLEQKSGV